MDSPTPLTDHNADLVARRLSRHTPGCYVVTYADAKNGGRVCLNLYPNTPDNQPRIARQIKMNKARAFAAGVDMTAVFSNSSGELTNA